MSERLGGAAVALPSQARALVRQGISFLAVGGLGFVIDAGVFNALRATVLSPQHVVAGALWAKVVSVCLAILVNWIGNRMITFRRERRVGGRRALAREGVEFFAASALGSIVALVCLGISHYLLGLTSAVADNISANVVGLALGTGLRFLLYRTWVFRALPNRDTQDRVEIDRRVRDGH